jgi:hypothetical protein
MTLTKNILNKVTKTKKELQNLTNTLREFYKYSCNG